MRQGFKLAWLAVFMVLLFGCASTEEKPMEAEVADVDDHGGEMPGLEGAETSGIDSGSTFQGHPLDDPASPLYQRVIYFDFDSSTISPRDKEALAAHAGYLVQHSEVVLTLEGHADERGSREYNIALGERRALAVRRVLEFNGVQRRQLSTVSYGEEKPVAFGHDDSAWRLNRRVEMVYPRY